MSAPATNDLSPDPVMTMARTVSSRLSSRAARRKSSRVALLSALSTFGRLIVMTATAASRSISRFSKAMSGSNYIPGVQREGRHRRTNRVGHDVHGLDVSRRHKRLMKLIAHSVGRGDQDRGDDDSPRETAMPSAGQSADEQRAKAGVQGCVQILIQAVTQRRRL